MKLLEPLLFRDERPVRRLALMRASEPADVLAQCTGHFALHEEDEHGDHLLARDLLGVHKLFFALGDDGSVDTSTFLFDLLRAGHPVERVFSVPSGHYVRLCPEARRYALVRWSRLEFGPPRAGPRPGSDRLLARFALPIHNALVRTFRMLAERLAGRPVYVALSGGLDSTTIAVLAREYLDNVCAVTFALGHPREAAPGTDLYFARRTAADLGIPQFDVIASPDQVLDLLDDVLVYGQDCRDFNVHCGLVNAALGEAIGALHASGPRPVILTGDTMNELMADYAPVRFGGKRYYELPELEPGRIRRCLVAGLDSGDREVGIFARFGVDTVQPYALCAREYAALPEELASGSSAKARLVRCLMGESVPEYVYQRPKVRAQVAVEGEPGGTLALLANRGIDQEALQSRFAELLGIDARSARHMSRGGFYRFSTSFPGSERDSA